MRGGNSMPLIKEDLQAITEIIDDRMNPISKRLESLENSMNERFEALEKSTNNQFTEIYEQLGIMEVRHKMTLQNFDGLAINIKLSERDLRKNILLLQDNLMEILEKNRTLPSAE